MKYAERIRELRIEKKINRETLAKVIGVSERAIAFWETGVNEPKASYIIKLAEYFGVTAGYILGVEE